MVRPAIFLVACCCVAASGCQSLPVQTTTKPPPPQRTIALFTEVDAQRDAVKQVVLDRVPPGTPIAKAQEILETQGFACRPYSGLTHFFFPEELVPSGVRLPQGAYQRLHQARKDRPVYCRATLHELQEWHLQSYVVLVVLIPDETQTLRDVEVGICPQRHNYANYFKSRPDLREPIDLPIEAARARMEAAGFRCAWVTPRADEAENRPHLLCEAFDENAIGGDIVRVSLFPDGAGVIRETNVLNREHPFDAERCMLPHGDESPAEAACRCVLFPVRAGCRYTLFTIGVCMAITAMPYGLR
jgi:hypothetical protein